MEILFPYWFTPQRISSVLILQAWSWTQKLR